MSEIIMLLAVLAGLAYTFVKVRTQVHMLQLNSYRNERYIRWLGKNPARLYQVKDVLPLFSLPLLAAGYVAAGLSLWIAAHLLLVLTNKRTAEKKKLVYTFRVKRLLAGIALILIVPLAIFAPSAPGLLATLSVAYLLPFVPVLAGNFLLRPVEKGVEGYYVRQAKARLAAMKGLTVVGLTGSYGKTSTKNVLAKILAARYNVLMTPESYNTTMGVVRTIRELLKPTHEVFVVEMGAMQPGDIRELCDIAAPTHAVLTAIGEQHLETFKNLDTVKKTKYEIVEAVPEGGTAYLNYDDENVRSLPRPGRKRYVLYGMASDAVDYYGYNIKFDANGTGFTVRTPGGEEGEFTTKLLGRHNVSNILAGIAVASELGMDLKTIARAVRDLRPVEHRLSINKHPNNVTVLDDAFNSNPVGARMALEVLGEFAGKKKILVTPGMVELGARHYDLNKAFGEQAAGVCDYVILVGQRQTEPIRDGLAGKNYPPERCFVARNLAEAVQHMQTVVAEGDVVLFENDLPDTYNE
ncbi:MAG TPA: UDP-N-acetylmuramoyl-tripeptide--D-alanyl-D-alanine ligase [Negativicutes bacterium]|nr:UDP-N-acetylmuramoyl-tripeptide--D-alanyl-D-alanine ligase [Negativicutes bacterium]